MINAALYNNRNNKRTQYLEVPPRVEYEYTDLANSLTPVFDTLEEWGDKYDDIICKSRNEYDDAKS